MRHTTRNASIVTSIFVAAALTSGCSGKKSKADWGSEGEASASAGPSHRGGPSAPPPVSAAARQEANDIFSSRCAVCHGPKGAGDGPASAGLTPKPRNFTDTTWQGGVNDEHIEKIIQYGGTAVGKSAAMPPNPDLMSKPDTVAALRLHVRSLAQ